MATTKNLKRPKLKIASIGAGFALLLLCAAAAAAARWGWANAVQIDASDELQRWDTQYLATGQYPTQQAWMALHDQLKDAAKLDAHNVYVLDTQGLLYLHRYQQQLDLPAADTSALHYFQQAAVVRPASPFTWANIVLAKYRLGQIDDDLYNAMQHAYDLGPWEAAVQFVVVDKGLALWSEMPDTMRAMVKQLAENGTRRNASAMLQIASNRGRLDVVCAFEKLRQEAACRSFQNSK